MNRHERTMKDSLLIPDIAGKIYPHRFERVGSAPVVVFRDHRWTLPIIFLAAEKGLLKLPARIVSFDRHRDSLLTDNRKRSLAGIDRESLTFGMVVDIVGNTLSPRDDDWIPAGMELGIVSHVVQFGSADEISECTMISEYSDRDCVSHMIFHLGRPARELSYKGALADSGHAAVEAGLWDIFGWDPLKAEFSGDTGELICDFDLDFFTFSWERYTFPYTDEIFRDEFMQPCQSVYSANRRPSDVVRSLRDRAVMVTIASEPIFCGGADSAQTILDHVNRMFFDSLLESREIDVDYAPVYPSE